MFVNQTISWYIHLLDKNLINLYFLKQQQAKKRKHDHVTKNDLESVNGTWF